MESASVSPLIPAAQALEFAAIAKKSQDRRSYNLKKSAYAKEKYPYIPLNIDSFERLMHEHVKVGMRVIDVGCGAGDKLYAFHALKKGLTITGLEYDKSLVVDARRICGAFATILQGDARKHDYAPYDLIYMYRPMTTAKGQGQIQEQVMRTARIGAKVIIVYQEHYNLRMKRMFPDFYAGWTKTGPYNPKAGKEVVIPPYIK